MSSLIIPDQSAVLATAGLIAPKLVDFVVDVPLTDLTEIWRSISGVHLDAGKIDRVAGFLGHDATQFNPGKQPTLVANRIDFTGSGDYLETTLTPPPSGYLVCKAIPKVIGAATVFIGSSTSAASPSMRIGVGFNLNNFPAAQIGVRSMTANLTPAPVQVDVPVTVGLVWDGNDGSYRIRVNGTQEYSGTAFNSGGAGVGTFPLWIGANNNSGSPSGEGAVQVIAAALYGGVIDSDTLAAIDAGIMAIGS